MCVCGRAACGGVRNVCLRPRRVLCTGEGNCGKKPLQPHVEEGIGPALFVRIRPTVRGKAHVFIEADRLRVLLVDGDFVGAEGAHGIAEQRFADPRAALFGRDEQHLDPPVFHARKRRDRAAFALRGDQALHALQRLRDVGSDPAYFGVGQKIVRRPHGPLPHAEEGGDGLRRSVSDDGNFDRLHDPIIPVPRRKGKQNSRF